MTGTADNLAPQAVLLVSGDAKLVDRLEQSLESLSETGKLMHVGRVGEAVALLANISPDAILLDLTAIDEPITSALAELSGKCPLIALCADEPGARQNQALTARQAEAVDVFPRTQANGPMLNQAIHHAIERAQHIRKIRQLEEQLFHAQKMESLGLLSGGVAHDFNNLLVAILGHADVALRDTEDPQRVESCLQGIKRASIRASDLAAQLLSYTGKNEFELHPCSLNRLIEEMMQLLHASIARKVHLQLELADDLPAVDMDPTQIRQVVLNLITNAAESIGENSGSIRVQTGLSLLETPDADSQPSVQLTISDTGCGMDEETLEQIFEPFFSTKVGGRGLGMAAVQGIVARHKGVLHAESQPDEGTTFQIAFPASSKPAETPTCQAEHTPAPSSKTCRTVLVIDDEEDVREILQMMLESTGLVVLTAADGPEGIELFRRQSSHIAAVLLDMTMPRMSGVEVLNELRVLDEDVPVLLCSGYGPQNTPGKLPLDQIAGFIAKPFEMDHLLETVFAVIEKSAPPPAEQNDSNGDESPSAHRSAG